MTMVHNLDDESSIQANFVAASRTLARKLDALKQPAAHSETKEDPEVVVDQKTQVKLPWLVEHHLDGDVNVDDELMRRFPIMPLMATIRLRELGGKHRRSLATLATQDGAATLALEVDVATGALQLTYTLSSMLSLRFHPDGLSQRDRAEWMQHMRQSDEKPGFLWGQMRWQHDFVVGVPHRFYTNLYAFSSQHEAAARLTPDVTQKVLRWLGDLWSTDETITSRASLW